MDGLIDMALLSLGQLAGERANKKPERRKRFTESVLTGGT
jgi:hypothetical protein